MSRVRRSLGFWGLLVVSVVALSVAAGAFVVRKRLRWTELKRAQQAMVDGRYPVAREILAGLADSWVTDGEVLVLLGDCELARGRREDALAAWARVPPASPFFHRSALLRATHLVNSGRYTPAEQILAQALAKPGDDERYELERALSRLYRFEGRFDDVKRVVRASWFRSPEPAVALKELWALDHSPMPVESWGLALEKADKDDDRVWLGRANNAILTGHFQSAALWLDRCLRRRPEDLPVWQARLDLAMAAGDVAGFWSAAGHLPAARFDAARVHTLRAWLAATRQDSALEERELRALLEVAPGNTKALERLAVLSFQASRSGETEAFHRRKARIDSARDRFRKTILDASKLVEQAGLLEQLSNELGRTFDARAWALVAAADSRSLALAEGRPRSDGRLPLPPELAAKAAALCAPYTLNFDDGAERSPKLGDRLADMRSTTKHPPTEAATAGAESEASIAPGGAPQFIDDAPAAGLHFVFDNGQTPQHFLPETMSGGLGLLDFDGDGWLDVYCVQGGPILDQGDDAASSMPPEGDRLFRNRGDGTFEDVTRAAGITRIAWGKRYGLGVAVGDFDNDSHPDVFVSRLRSYALYRNRGDGTFEDVTERAGLAGLRDNPTSAAFADLDNDGDLDLYVCHYMIWDPEHPRLCQTEKGEYFYCDPSKVEPAPDHVFRNDGGRFVDVTEQSGCAEFAGRGLGVVAADIDDDNRIDLYVANDGTANYLFRNLGDFRFKEIALEAGVAGNAEGGYQAGMGVACGDLDGDGRPDFLVTNFYGEGTTLYQNLGGSLFCDRSSASGIGLATRYLLGFGIAMADVSNHGRLDVLATNGHVNDNRPYYPYAMTCRLYQNQPGGRLVDISRQSGAPFLVERVGRGLAAGDLDNDGRVDALVLAQNEPVAYFHNRTPQAGRFVTFRLEGTRSNRDGVGARVTVIAGSRRQVAQRLGGGSYQSAGDPRLHFGLGEESAVESVEVRWPSGRVDRWHDLSAGTGYLLREGDSKPRPLAGFARPRGK